MIPERKKQMKRILKLAFVVLVALILLVTLASCGSSAPASAEGDCGTNLEWSYDAETKSLTISGTGDMTDYDSSSEVPWTAIKYTAKSLNIENGVGSIGDKAFYGFTALEKISFGDTLTEIGDMSFAFCTALLEIDLPTSLITVGDSAFEGCSALTVAFIPENVTSIGSKTFAYCYSITDAAVLAVTTVPEDTFLNCRSIENLLLRDGITEEMTRDAFEGAGSDYASATKTTSPTGAANVTVKYVLPEDAEIETPADDVKENIPFKDSFTIVPPTVEGYTPSVMSVSGEVYGEDKEFTVTYSKVVEETTTAADEKDENEEGPSTSTIIAVVIFGIVLVGIVIAAILIIRYEKKAAKQGSTVRKNQNNKNNNHKKHKR